MAKKPPEDDFDPKDAILKLSATIEQPDKFAELFCTAAKTQKNIDSAIRDIIRDMLKNDNDAKSVLIDAVRTVDREDWKYFTKKIGFWGWSLIVVFGTLLCEKFFFKNAP